CASRVGCEIPSTWFGVQGVDQLQQQLLLLLLAAADNIISFHVVCVRHYPLVFCSLRLALCTYARMPFLVHTQAPSLESPIALYVTTLFSIVFARNLFFLNRFYLSTESGWSLKTKPFFSNFGAICTFAFAGTLISTLLVGCFMYFVGLLHAAHAMPIMVCLAFGALISATDPVSVLAVFQQLGVDRTLYAQVFGESVLNDAVAIVLYRTMLSFVTTKVDGRGIWFAISFFLANFVGSFSIGVILGLLSALVFKHCGFEDDGLALLQASLLSLFPYMAYMLADAFELSGIVAILFAGMTMRYYTAPHLNEKALATTSSFFSILAKLSETFVFIYMGVAVFLEKQSWRSYSFTLYTILAILIARVFNIYPLAYIVNAFRQKQSRIPMNHQHALWFSGLRGAMAFALALQCITDLPDEYGRVILTSTLLTIAFTVLFIGGATSHMLSWLKIECSGARSEHDDQDSPNEEILVAQIPEKPQSNLKKKFQQLKEKASFASIDKNFLTPVFATPSRSHPRLVELDQNITPPQAHRPSSSSVDGTERRTVEIELAPVDELFPIDDDSMTVPLTTALSLPLEGGHLSRRASANSQQGG
ncbi:unnamed protein product, partial [Closterium sp. NIES-54]